MAYLSSNERKERARESHECCLCSQWHLGYLRAGSSKMCIFSIYFTHTDSVVTHFHAFNLQSPVINMR